MYFFYSLVIAIGAILAAPYFLIQGLRRGKHLHNLSERFGKLPARIHASANSGPGPIWVHGVSVGETLAALPLVRQLRERFSDRRLVFSTTTATGQQLARERLGDDAAVFYFPFDWSFAVRRAFRVVRPSVVVILETEIWPNFLRVASSNQVPVVFVNGRLSERSFRRYQRGFAWMGFFLKPFLRRVFSTASLFLMQSKEDAGRLLSLGAAAEKVQVSGNLKYDQELAPSSPLADWLETEVQRGERRPLVVAGSVVASEEPLVLIAFGILQGEWRRALLVLAPRKPQRFDAAADFINESKRKFIRRSALPGATLADDVSVVLLDSVGELAGLYRAADAVFVGGSLVPSGGHNILEPAAFAKVPIFGPSMGNFREVAASFLAAGAAIEVHSPEDLGVAWIELVKDAARREQMGAASQRLVESSRGATTRSLESISRFLSQPDAPRPDPARRAPQSSPGFSGTRMIFSPFVRCLLWPLSFLYGVFVRLRVWCYRKSVLKAQRIRQPVISIGNLTVGGTGKTPIALWLAQRLQAEGKRVGILSRGYRGQRQAARKGLSGASSKAISSDEVRMLVERLQVPVGIGANRYRSALAMEREGIEVFLLDDGFQHLRLARDLDIVLLDATNPFGGGWLLPAGPLREPPSALSRADVVLITRSEHAPAVETLVRRHSTVPIFYAQTRLVGVHERSRPSPGSSAVDAQQYRYLMFCGIGNPQAFRDDLSRWGIKILGSTFFRDHHQYTQREADQLERLAIAMDANGLLCTEKDVFNLEGVDFKSLPVHFCKVDLVLNDKDAFLYIIRDRLNPHAAETPK